MEAQPPRPGSYSLGSTRNLLILLVLALATFAQGFGIGCLFMAPLPMTRDLDGFLWDGGFGVGSVFLLCMVLAQPLFNEVSSISGRKPALVLSLVLFIIGTGACASADSTAALLFGIIMQGAGSGGLEPVKLHILCDLFDLRARSKCICLMYMPWAVGSCTLATCLFASPFTQGLSTWRILVWVNALVLMVDLILALLTLGYDDQPGRCWRFVRRADFGGLSLFVPSGILILLALAWAGSRYSWDNIVVGVCLSLGTVGLVVLGWYESRRARKPVFPPSAFRENSTVVHLICVLLHGLGLSVMVSYTWFYYLHVMGFGVVDAGLLMAAYATVIAGPMSMVVGVTVFLSGSYKVSIGVGWIAMVAAFLAARSLTEHASYAALIGHAVAAGAGTGSLIPAMTVGIQGTVDSLDAGHAMCMTLLVRLFGYALGMATGSSLFSAELGKRLRSSEHAAEDVQQLIEMLARTGARDAFKLDPAVVPAAVEALDRLWIMGAAISAVAMVLNLLADCPALPPDNDNSEHESAVDPPAYIA